MGKRRARRQFRADFKRRVVAESYARAHRCQLWRGVTTSTPTSCSAGAMTRDMRFRTKAFYPSRSARRFKTVSLPMNSHCLQSLGYGSQVTFALSSKAGLNRRP